MDNHCKPKQRKTLEDKGYTHLLYWNFKTLNVIFLVFKLMYCVFKMFAVLFVFNSERHEQLSKAKENHNINNIERNKILSRSVEISYEDVVECVKVKLVYYYNL